MKAGDEAEDEAEGRATAGVEDWRAVVDSFHAAARPNATAVRVPADLGKVGVAVVVEVATTGLERTNLQSE